jgi:hypothetical protein
MVIVMLTQLWAVLFWVILFFVMAGVWGTK